MGIAIAVAVSMATSVKMLGEIVKYYSDAPPADGITAFERRFDEVKKALPGHGVVGYVTDVDMSDTNAQAEFNLTQYTLAPLWVTESSEREWVIGSFHASAPSAQFLTSKNLILVRDFGAGLYLFRGSKK